MSLGPTPAVRPEAAARAAPWILLVDDDRAITDFLGPLLERAGFAVTVAHDGDTALRQVAEQRPDLVVLDVMIPGPDGREVCRRIRSAGDWTPVIMLTQVDSAFERAESLDEGADDYLGKPFDSHELVARIRAVLRRRQLAPDQRPLSISHRLRSGEVVLDRRQRRVFREGRSLELSPKALALLEYFMLHPGEVLTRERLLNAVWAWDHPVASRAVDVRVAELRRVLGDEAQGDLWIETRVGQGYCFVAPVESASDERP